MNPDPGHWSEPEHARAAVARRAITGVILGMDPRAVEEVYTTDPVIHFLGSGAEPTVLHGRPVGDRDPWSAFRSGFTDMDIGIQSILADGDRVAAEILVSARHTGDFRGFAATGNRFEVPGFLIFRFEDDLIDEQWNLVHALGLMQQLGLVPTSAGNVARLLSSRLRGRLARE